MLTVFRAEYAREIPTEKNKLRRAGNLKIELSLSTAIRYFFSFFFTARTIGIVTYFFQPLSFSLLGRKKQIKIGKNSVEFLPDVVFRVIEFFLFFAQVFAVRHFYLEPFVEALIQFLRVTGFLFVMSRNGINLLLILLQYYLIVALVNTFSSN